MDYWDDDYINDVVKAYRKDRDPAQLSKLIMLDPDAMQAPAIGRLFLDMINNKLPFKKKPKSTEDVRVRAVSLVVFYIGQGLNRSNAYPQAGFQLKKSGDTIKGYFEDWLKDFTVKGWPYDVITEAEFWSDPEKYLAHDFALKMAFADGRLMTDEKLATATFPDRDIRLYRQFIRDMYENQKPFELCDPWEAREKLWLLNFELEYLEDDEDRE